MSKAANRAKTKWNASKYRQVKVSVAISVAAAFQATCTAAGVSMASVLSSFMAEYGGITVKESQQPRGDLSTKKKRRQAVDGLIDQLVRIRVAQEQAMNNIPESLRDAGAYVSAEESVALMGEAIELLDAYTSTMISA